MLSILNIHTAYNELTLLRYKYEYCKKYGLYLYVIDNMSNDGTKEFLEQNNIQHSFLDTDGAFDLRPLLDETNRMLHEIKPDWFIYSGVDMFYESKKGIRGSIESADAEGYSSLRTLCYTIRSTGEYREGNPFKVYHCATKGAQLTLISKYNECIKIIPDQIFGKKGIVKDEGNFYEMHGTKRPEERKETLRRREKAWDNGMNKGWGTHYLDGDAVNFTFNKESMLDLSDDILYKKLGDTFDAH